MISSTTSMEKPKSFSFASITKAHLLHLPVSLMEKESWTKLKKLESLKSSVSLMTDQQISTLLKIMSSKKWLKCLLPAHLEISLLFIIQGMAAMYQILTVINKTAKMRLSASDHKKANINSFPMMKRLNASLKTYQTTFLVFLLLTHAIQDRFSTYPKTNFGGIKKSTAYQVVKIISILTIQEMEDKWPTSCLLSSDKINIKEPQNNSRFSTFLTEWFLKTKKLKEIMPDKKRFKLMLNFKSLQVLPFWVCVLAQYNFVWKTRTSCQMIIFSRWLKLSLIMMINQDNFNQQKSRQDQVNGSIFHGTVGVTQQKFLFLFDKLIKDVKLIKEHNYF